MGIDEKSARTAINQLAPLWRIRQIESANGTPGDVISDIELRVSALCRREASQLCQTIDIGGDNTAWAESYFSGLIAGMIADKWAEAPQEAESFAYAEHLASLAAEPMYAGLPSSWHGTQAEVSYVATTLSAISRAMQSYSKFNLFHFERDKVQNFFTEQIITSAQEATKRISPKLTEQPDINSASSLYQTLLRQAGTVMADLWQSASVDVISVYRMASHDEREELQTPFDLSILSGQLRSAMNSLADGAILSLDTSQQLKASTSFSPT